VEVGRRTHDSTQMITGCANQASNYLIRVMPPVYLGHQSGQHTGIIDDALIQASKN
jgi:hypothetical protein